MMYNARKKAAVLFCLSLMFSISWAQSHQDKVRSPGAKNMSPELKAQKKTDAMARHLDLSEAQKEQIYSSHLQAIKARENLTKEHRSAVRSLGDQNRQRVSGVLTDVQKARWEGIQTGKSQAVKKGKKMRGKRAQRHHRMDRQAQRMRRQNSGMRNRSRI